jgi:hypothetical protein
MKHELLSCGIINCERTTSGASGGHFVEVSFVLVMSLCVAFRLLIFEFALLIATSGKVFMGINITHL